MGLANRSIDTIFIYMHGCMGHDLHFTKTVIMNLLRREGRRLIGHVVQSNMSQAGVGTSSGQVMGKKMMMMTTMMASPVAVLSHVGGVGYLRVCTSDVGGACRRMGSVALLVEVRWFSYLHGVMTRK
jgi:hypothetical protein